MYFYVYSIVNCDKQYDVCDMLCIDQKSGI